MNILVVVPHPDDLEFGCVGTILKFIDDGATVDTIITVPPSTEINPNRSLKQTRIEFSNSMRFLNLKYIEYPTPLFKNGRPNLINDTQSITKLEKLIPKKHYDLVITTDPGDYHQDHVTTFNMVNSACRSNTNELWTMEILPYANKNTTFTPNVFVNITEFFDAKLKALSFYDSYITPKHIAGVNGQAKYRATHILATEYAEAFHQYFRNIT